MYKSPLFFGIIAPALMVLVGWWAYRTGHLNEFWFFYSVVMPALVCALGWCAFVLNEIAMRRERQRENYSLRGSERLAFRRAQPVVAYKGGNQSDKTGADRLPEAIEIINLVLPWVGSTARAVAWYRTRPLPDLDGQTAEQLVDEGRADAVKAHLARVPPADLL